MIIMKFQAKNDDCTTKSTKNTKNIGLAAFLGILCFFVVNSISLIASRYCPPHDQSWLLTVTRPAWEQKVASKGLTLSVRGRLHLAWSLGG